MLEISSIYCSSEQKAVDGAGVPIERRWDQPANGGGNYYRFKLSPRAAHSWRQPID